MSSNVHSVNISSSSSSEEKQTHKLVDSLPSSRHETLAEVISNDGENNERQQREIMSIHDVEAYLLEKYQHMEDQWKEKNAEITMPHHHHEQEAHKQQTERMQQCAKVDAASIFQLLLQHLQIVQVVPKQHSQNVNSANLSAHSPPKYTTPQSSP